MKMSIDYEINGVNVKISREDYEKIRYAKDLEERMRIAKKYDRLRAFPYTSQKGGRAILSGSQKRCGK